MPANRQKYSIVIVSFIGAALRYYGLHNTENPDEYNEVFEALRGADGAIFVIRKKLYQPLKNYDINDFVIPLNVIRQGYRDI